MNKDLTHAKNGAEQFLKQKGIDTSKLNSFSTISDKINYAKSVVQKKDETLVESIINENYLPDENFSFKPFYKSNTRTAGDSAEWYRYFIQLDEGNSVEKEVHFDLSKHYTQQTNLLEKNDI